jgi:serine/threonine-protein kinase
MSKDVRPEWSATVTVAPDAPLDVAAAGGLVSTVDATITASPDAPSVVVTAGGLRLPERYRDLGRIAAGGFGEIRRVHDTLLDRVVAMKLLRVEVGRAHRLEARFVAEAKLTAGLEHPGIVSVHDRGFLDDGRLWFTMREVRGRTLGEVIDEVHAAAGPEGFRETASGWTFRRLVDAFARVCQAVAFAHRRGVVHRDLKPDNIMVGELGEALVMDWGLGRRVGMPDEARDEAAGGLENPNLTQHGDVLGTPAYMPPEQALGQRDRHGLPSDVYALGAVLYHLLAGRPPYVGASAIAVLRQVLVGPPRSVIEAAAGKPIPAELSAICEKAMAREMEARYPDAEELSREVLAWLDGAHRREQALAVVAKARAMEPEIIALRSQASEKQREAQARLDGVRPFDPVEKKELGWALEDEARKLMVAAALRDAEWLETLQGALTVDPDLPEAHAALADHYKDRLLAAERAHREADAVRAEARLRAHDRGHYAALLRGEGRLSLVTDPPGAEVILERYVEHKRRLVPQELGPIGVTPIRQMPLEKGSYRLRIRAPGRAEVRYPVLIERDGHWDGCAPGESEPYPIVLPREEDLGEDDCYVPAGWSWIGGEVGAADTLPQRRIWVDAFVLRRFPVTNAEYLEFLNDLVATGREAEAVEACPRAEPSMPQASGELLFARDADGRFGLTSVAGDSAGQLWRPRWPIVMVDWYGATAYARWVAERSANPWRLPNEIEREKAARGADGRHYPWGYHFDATWACVIDTYARDATRVDVDRYPLDESPYGVRGLAGNTRDWCENVWTHEGPDVEGRRLRLAPPTNDARALRAGRGGAWSSRPELSRVEARFANQPGTRWRSTGLRLARSTHG